MTEPAPLLAADFADFYREVWQREPFPWQLRLVAQVLAAGAWPALLDLPTGVGKTSAIDVALFCLAADSRRHARRIALVVDRRTIVDQTTAHMNRLAARIEGAADPRSALGRVAAALRAIGDGEPGPVVQVARLRGGAPLEADWARSPATPTLLASTVDQLGSRLLFRGYGLSDSMRPVHAGLLGNDCLFLLDEVHLSGPFAQTLGDVARLRRGTDVADGALRPWAHVALSATPGVAAGRRFELDGADLIDPRLAQRVGAFKPCAVQAFSLPADSGKAAPLWAEHLAGRARAHLSPGARVGLIVNRVDTALRCARLLAKDEADVLLVTGRMRPLDREALDARLMALAGMGRRRAEAGQRPMVLVSTQCVEAGIDLDLDALVTECASLDSLRQRAGRLNRSGDLQSAPMEVWTPSPALAAKAPPDPIYGTALAATHSFLLALGDPTEDGAVIDMGPLALARVHAQRAVSGLPALPEGPAVRPPAPAPRLMPAHLDALVQTSPRPAVEPSVELYLHGFEAPPPEVQVCWRVDVDDALLAAAQPSPEAAALLVAGLPPTSGETLSLPIWAARAWLGSHPVALSADLEGVTEERGNEKDEAARGGDGGGQLALRWAGAESPRTAVITAEELRPGDILVVPSARGGLLDGSFDGAAVAPVSDLAEAAWHAAHGQERRRLGPEALAAQGIAVAPMPPGADAAEDDEDGALSPREALRAWADGLPAARGAAMKRLLRRARIEVQRPPGRRGSYLLIGPGGRATTEGEEGSQGLPSARPALLLPHLAGVGARAERFATAVGLPPAMVALLREAGRAHDLGKIDPRFQRLLYGGDPLAQRLAARRAPDDPWAHLRAKGDRLAPAARARARAAAGAPAGFRHELASVRLLLAGAMPEVFDADLLMHLVASHHGHCRPLAPICADPGAALVLPAAGGLVQAVSGPEGAVDDDHPERFWRSLRRYGPWVQAWLEALLRLADHRQSEAEAKAAEGPADEPDAPDARATHREERS